ncbi:unnamed protein product [Tuber aestivum]|uniref:Uncharacterized protein n=1 Tax=Tuber aestivum TaxID=59557 RepID=A0A292PK21_9PEZI|nr:unnamed protein product [Tuber aestivum]
MSEEVSVVQEAEESSSERKGHGNSIDELRKSHWPTVLGIEQRLGGLDIGLDDDFLSQSFKKQDKEIEENKTGTIEEEEVNTKKKKGKEAEGIREPGEEYRDWMQKIDSGSEFSYKEEEVPDQLDNSWRKEIDSDAELFQLEDQELGEEERSWGEGYSDSELNSWEREQSSEHILATTSFQEIGAKDSALGPSLSLFKSPSSLSTSSKSSLQVL